MRKRTIVPAGDPRSLEDIVASADIDPRAIREGRVFVGRRRVVRGDTRVQAGDVIEVGPAPAARPDAVIAVLLRTDSLVAVDKPAGIPTIPDHAGTTHALTTLAGEALGIDASRLHPTSRLDRDVSGVVVFALTREGADRLARARDDGTYDRSYVAIAHRAPAPPKGEWNAAIGRANDPRLRKVGGRDPVAARTRYSVCGATPAGQALLAVAPITGRTHQIRVHAAHAGAALLGDRPYGGALARVVLADGRVLEPGRIALHAWSVTVPDTRPGSTLTVTAPVPDELRDLWSAVGGDPSSWDLCAACDLTSP
jgi:RluA family pseudouridine synthase